MFMFYSLKALERGINQVLTLDNNATAHLVPLQNKTLVFNIRPLWQPIALTFTSQGIELLPGFVGRGDATISATGFDLARLAYLSEDKKRALFQQKIKLEGDVEFVQQVNRFAAELDIDWETHLASYLGDGLAHQIGSWLRWSKAKYQGFCGSLENNTNNYLTDELRVFPSREEVDHFFTDTEDLLLRVERLEATINCCDHDL